MNNGIIGQNLFGGGQGNGTYTPGVMGNVNVTVNNGNIGSIYGGSDVVGTINGYTNVQVLNGTISGNIYGGGKGGFSQNSNFVARDVDVVIGTSSVGPTIGGSVYGGSAFGSVNGTTNNTNVTSYTTEVIVNNGTISQDVFGGGEGNGTYSPGMLGNLTVNINNGTIRNVYGGNNLAGTPNGFVKVYLNGGTITDSSFGGGNSSSVKNTEIYLQGASTDRLFGGSNSSGTVTSSLVTVTSGTVGGVFGGNNIGGTLGTANVYINGGTITRDVHGGGNEVATTTTNVYLNNASNTIANIYGGGKNANAGTTSVFVQGINATNLFGGSNTGGVVTLSNVNITSGTIDTVYGGNNLGGTTATSNITATGGTITNAVYGGGNVAPTGTTHITLTNLTNTVPSVFGGGHSANATTTNVTMQGVNAIDVYGGSNLSGVVGATNVNITTGTIDTVYGGGNIAVTTNATVHISGGTIDDVYGGGNAAEVTNNTYLEISGAQVLTNAYGGGNEGEVLGNTEVHITNGIIEGSLYAGGNGVTAIVYGNATVNVEGQSIIGTPASIAPTSGSVFGGGNAAATGTENSNNSTSTVNIVGGTVYGNVYGGANTSVVYGTVYVNLGYNAVGNNTLTKSDIYVVGTIFGGGEANASGSEIYDYSFVSVTQGIRMNIDGTGHTSFMTQGSIFGSGNASSTTGTSLINIKNYGTIDNPQKNISIQRATTVTLDNSSISLSGATDRTNEYSSTNFSLSRIDELKLKNNSSVYLAFGANLLKKVSSLVDVGAVETKAFVNIDASGNTVKNVDNRIYLLEGKNLNIATNEQVTTYGEVNGMMFLGVYTSRLNPDSSSAFYGSTFENGDIITNEGVFSNNVYVLGLHKNNHNLSVDGFYTNYNEDGYIKKGYVGVHSEEDVFYMWTVGGILDVTSFEVSMTASKYATLGTHELVLAGFGTPNTKFTMMGFSSGIIPGVSLINHKDIKDIADTSAEANTTLGLGIKSGRTGWKTNSYTDFYSANGGSYSGSIIYDKDSSTYAPTLLFYFYHSANISVNQELGDAKIRFQALIPIDALTYSIQYVDVNLTFRTAVYQDDYYEAAIAPGEEYDFFSTTETNITKKSTFSTYYSLYIPNFSSTQHYINYSTSKHVLVSRDEHQAPYVFLEDSRIIMLDLVTNKYYYYVVTSTDEANGRYVYELSDFIQMGSTNEYYNESLANSLYYRSAQDLVLEKFIFHVSFAGSELNQDIENNTLLLDLQDSQGYTKIGVLGIQRDSTRYGVYVDKEGTVDVTAILEQNVVYLGNTFNVDIETLFVQQYINSKIIYDTNSFDKKLGMSISFFNDSGVRLTGDELLGVSFIIDGIRYYPRLDGTVRIKLADRPSNIVSQMIVDTGNNSTLPTGTYTLKIEAFTSADGIYFGGQGAKFDEKEIVIINSNYGLKVSTDANSKIVSSITGFTDNQNNELDITVEYSSMLSNPNITVSLERRKYDTIYEREYEIVDLQEFVLDTLTESDVEFEYVVTDTPNSTNNFELHLDEELTTGTYKIVFKLYNGSDYIGEAYEYVIVK